MAKNLSSILRGTNYGTLPISSGGTGATTASAALAALGAQAILPAANGTTNGYLTSTDWTTFNSKLGSYTLPTAGASTLGGIKVGTGLTIDGNGILTTTNSGTVTSVAGTAPITSSGGATPTISIPAASTSASGYLTSTDWNTFNSKQAALSNASTSVSGILTSTDWNTFNSKQAALVSGTSIKTVNGTTLLGSGDLVISGGASATKTIANKTAAYTVVADDLGKIINCTSGTFTISLTAAATLGAGFTCTIWNTSNNNTSVVTIDPAATELIDGKPTLTLRRGEGLAIVCDGTGWLTDDKKPMRGYAENLNSGDNRPVASSDGSLAIGSSSTSSGSYGYAIGYLTQATGLGAAAIGVGYSTAIVAGANYSTAIGQNSTPTGSVTATGAGAMALGGSYASGLDSFAAAIGNNTSSYGALAQENIAIGKNAKSSGGYDCVALGAYVIASGNASVAIGFYNQAQGIKSVALGGDSNYAVGNYSTTIGGMYARANQIGKIAFGYGGVVQGGGDTQAGKIILAAATNTTVVVLTSDGAAASTTNQLIVATNQAMAIRGTLIAKQSGNGNIAAWNITGAVCNNNGTMTSTGLALTLIGTDSIGFGTQPAISLDTTNKAVKITSGTTGLITRYVATLDTSEVIF